MKYLICGALAVLAIIGGCQGALPSYSECDANCGKGHATSEKQCPAVATENSICYQSVVDCNTVPCDADYGSFGACSAPCDGGDKSRPNGDTLPCNTQPCELPDMGNCAADLVFLLDRSASMTELQFELAKAMVHDLILTQNVGPNGVNVGVISFAYDAVVEYTETASAAESAIKALQISQTGGGTFPAYAIRELNAYMAANGRPNVPKIAVVITDGVELLYQEETQNELTLARNNGIKIYAVNSGPTSDLLNKFVNNADDVFQLNDLAWMDIANKLVSEADCGDGQIIAEIPGTPVLLANELLKNSIKAKGGVLVCDEYSDWGSCSVPCGAKGLRRSSRTCRVIVDGQTTETVTQTKFKQCFIECTTTTTTTTPKPTTTSDGICERCDYTKGQIWVTDTDNCHKYYICEKVDDVDGMWYWRKWHVHCGQLYWDQSRKTCTPEMQPGCINGPAEDWVGPSTTIGPCPFEVLADPRLFQHIETGDIFNCTEGMIFNETECTCVVYNLVRPACSDDLLLHFPYDVDYDDITCHNAKGYAYGDGIVGIVDDAERGMVAEFDGMTRLEVPFMRSWFKDQQIEGFTVSLWVKRDAANDGRVGFVNNGDCINETTFGIYGDENSGQNAYGVLDTVPSGLQQTAPASMTNQWTHLAMVYDIIDMVLYVNGVPGAPVSMFGPIANVQNPMVIGFIGNQPGRGFFEGRIDDLRVYTRALGQGDITKLFKGIPLVGP